jgi:hypothetical protein
VTLDLEAIEKRLTERFGASNDGTWRDIAPLIAEVRRLRDKVVEFQRAEEAANHGEDLWHERVIELEAQVKRYAEALREIEQEGS